MTILAQHMQNVRRPHEPGPHLGAVLPDHLRQIVRCLLRILSKTKVHRQDMFCLCRIIRECPAESRHDPLSQSFILCHVLSKDLSGLDDQSGGICIERRSDEIISRRSLVAARRCIQSQPVTEMPSAGPQILCGGDGSDIIHPFLHAVELIGEDLRIPVSQIDLPRADGGCVTPGSAGIVSRKVVRDHHTDSAVFPLLRRHIMEPLGKESFHIKIVAGGLHEHLGISGPAQPLIPLRAVRRHIQEISLLSPENVGDQLVDHGIPRPDISGLFNVGADDNPCEIR